MPTTPDDQVLEDPSPTAVIGDAHQDVMAAVVALEDVLSQPVEPAAEWLQALDRQLGCLHDVLHAHFDDEREGELYGKMPERFPQYAGRLQALAEEHDELLRRTDELRRQAKKLGPETETYRLRELNGRAQLLAAILRRHEAEENEVVMRAYWDDVGTGD